MHLNKLHNQVILLHFCQFMCKGNGRSFTDLLTCPQIKNHQGMIIHDVYLI